MKTVKVLSLSFSSPLPLLSLSLSSTLYFLTSEAFARWKAETTKDKQAISRESLGFHWGNCPGEEEVGGATSELKKGEKGLLGRAWMLANFPEKRGSKLYFPQRPREIEVSQKGWLPLDTGALSLQDPLSSTQYRAAEQDFNEPCGLKRGAC